MSNDLDEIGDSRSTGSGSLPNVPANSGFLEEKLSSSVRKLFRHYYPDYGPSRFHELLFQNIRSTDQVLEIGAGSGRCNQRHFNLRNVVARYVGIDPDPSVLKNPYLDQAYQCKAESLPFADASFDLVFHCFIAEHFESPITCNREINRVLKPNGLLLFQTPSRYYYPMLIASITPHWFHELYVRYLGSGRTKGEVFTTFYRLNDDQTITKQLHNSGFQCEIEHQSTPPGYLRFSVPSFLAGVVYERTIERKFPALRGLIIVMARKIA